MQIDIPVHVIQNLRKLLTDLSNAFEEHADSEYTEIYYDDQDSGDNNSDPVTFKSINTDTLELANTLKKQLRL